MRRHSGVALSAGPRTKSRCRWPQHVKRRTIPLAVWRTRPCPSPEGCSVPSEGAACLLQVCGRPSHRAARSPQQGLGGWKLWDVRARPPAPAAPTPGGPQGLLCAGGFGGVTVTLNPDPGPRRPGPHAAPLPPCGKADQAGPPSAAGPRAPAPWPRGPDLPVPLPLATHCPAPARAFLQEATTPRGWGSCPSHQPPRDPAPRFSSKCPLACG